MEKISPPTPLKIWLNKEMSKEDGGKQGQRRQTLINLIKFLMKTEAACGDYSV